MRQSKYFLKTSKQASADDVSINAKFLEQGGFVQKVLAGVYSFLPLGVRVLSKIEKIVREEMDAAGANEVFMPSLHPKENWQATGRWTGLDVLFKLKSQHGSEYALGPTHEEIVTPMALPIIQSYKDLPLAVYQIQTKFRDEPRAKSGLLRGREFRMKDLYSYHASAEDMEDYYNNVMAPAYKKVYERIGLNAVYTEASGGTFSKFSHEYQVEIENGEDTIFICESCGLAKNKEMYEDSVNPVRSQTPLASAGAQAHQTSNGMKCTACGLSGFRETKASEVGNIFKLLDKYSKPFNLQFTDKDGLKKPVLMGCYGIGTTRLMGVLVEKFNDKNGIIWPQSVAPFKAHLLALRGAEKEADNLYQVLLERGVEVLYDDRDASPGVKFADSDLIGIPYRIIISEKTLKEESVEVKKRNESESKLVKIKELSKLSF